MHQANPVEMFTETQPSCYATFYTGLHRQVILCVMHPSSLLDTALTTSSLAERGSCEGTFRGDRVRLVLGVRARPAVTIIVRCSQVDNHLHVTVAVSVSIKVARAVRERAVTTRKLICEPVGEVSSSGYGIMWGETDITDAVYFITFYVMQCSISFKT